MVITHAASVADAVEEFEDVDRHLAAAADAVAEIARGRGLGTIECSKTVLAVHAPVSLVLTEGNDDLEQRPFLLNLDPYATWMARGKPTDWIADSALLVDAAAYRAHILRIEPEALFE